MGQGTTRRPGVEIETRAGAELATGPAADLAGRRIAITGGGGFIGSHLVKRLHEAGAAVDLLGPTPLHRPEVARLIETGSVRYWPRALTGGSVGMRQPLRQCDSLVHLAYLLPCAREFWARLEQEATGNLLPTIRLWEAAEDARVEFICFASSVSVYPSNARGIREDGPPPNNPATPYAIVKVAQESALRHWTRLTGGRAAILRLATVYGPGETVARAIPNFIRSALAGSSPILDGHGSLPFDLIFVTDVVDAFIATLERRPNGTFNIGTGVEQTPRAVASMILDLCAARVDLLENPNAVERGGPICDVSRAADELGFRASTPLPDGLRQEIRWLAEPQPVGIR